MPTANVRHAGLSVGACRRFTVEKRGNEGVTSVDHDDDYEKCNVSLVHRMPLRTNAFLAYEGTSYFD